MRNNQAKQPLEDEGRWNSRKRHPLISLFLIDVLRDRDSRPAILWVLGTLLIGALFYHWIEGWSYLDSIYFSVVSLATVGYGDFTPKTSLGKIFTIVYLINGIVILLALFDRIRMVRSQRIQNAVISKPNIDE
jgi:voltage-gated potassium channel